MSMLPHKLRCFKPSGPTDHTNRFLQSFFKVLDSDGQKNLATDIEECADDDALRRLAKFIRNDLIIPIKAQGSKMSMEKTHRPLVGWWASPSVENEQIDRTPRQQLRTHCLQRDGNQCLVSGMWGRDHPHPENGKTVVSLEPARIIPFAIGSFQDNDTAAVYENSIVWANVNRYFPALRRISFTPEEINTERNILTLYSGAQYEFGHFRLLFEETNTPHVYTIKTFKRTASIVTRDLPTNRRVTFKVHGGQWDLPDPELLKIHAAIGNFLHMSGQAEAIDKIIRDFEECGGLGPSGRADVEGLLAASSLSLLDHNRRADIPSPKV